MKYNPEKYQAPFRVGKKQRRAVMDATGREVLLFHKGDEEMATAYCDYLNNEYWKVKRNDKNHIPKIIHDGWNGTMTYDVKEEKEKYWTCICGYKFPEYMAVTDRNLIERCPKCDTALGGSPE